ncbi:MAG: hypothetical protein ACYC0V_17200 [Armatimonadota bacterium]
MTSITHIVVFCYDAGGVGAFPLSRENHQQRYNHPSNADSKGSSSQSSTFCTLYREADTDRSITHTHGRNKAPRG